MTYIAKNEKFQLVEEDVNNYVIYKDGEKIAWGRYKGDMCNMFLKFLKEDGNMTCTVDFSKWGL